MAAKEGATSRLEVVNVYNILFEAVGRFHTFHTISLKEPPFISIWFRVFIVLKKLKAPPPPARYVRNCVQYTIAPVLGAYSVFTTFIIVDLLNMNQPPFKLG